jgi:hypothetical protein
MSPARTFDKYAAYAQSVQSPQNDARFLRRAYRELRGVEPKVLREDFCAAFSLCCEWVKLGNTQRAIGIDIDPEPLQYGHAHYLSLLTASQQERIAILKRDVTKPKGPRADIICALNFSYFLLKKRDSLAQYFKVCRQSLAPNGVFIVDAFGGPDHEEPHTLTRRLPGLTYYFEQESFDPVTREARFHIHFKPKKMKVQNRAFTYDWRMWTLPEIRDAMSSAGFKHTCVYWEGTARNGRGNGVFTRKERGEPCRAWIAYVIGIR